MIFNEIRPIVPGPLTPSDPIFIKLESLKVMDIYKVQVSKFMFKCINKIAPINFHTWFKVNHERYGYNTRSNININDGKLIKNLFIPYARTTNYGLKQLKVNGPRIWNAMPSNIKNITSIHVFLKNLKAHYISEYG